jgi:dipicolinate synthase subunit B
MEISEKKIGVALTGSFCTFEKAFQALEALKAEGADLYPIFSVKSQNTSCRFGDSEEFLSHAQNLCGRKVITTIEDAEPIGPSGFLDALIILPCTGNTIARLANGITDGPVTMAAKAHLRNEKPLLISLSTNDALSTNLKNIGMLMNMKNIYFVPFGQDNPDKKPHSMVADTGYLIPALKACLEHRQYQPVIISPLGRSL